MRRSFTCVLDGFADLVVAVGFVCVLGGFGDLLAFLAFLCLVLILMLLNFRMRVCGVWVVCVDLGVWVGVSGILLVLIFE